MSLNTAAVHVDAQPRVLPARGPAAGQWICALAHGAAVQLFSNAVTSVPFAGKCPLFLDGVPEPRHAAGGELVSCTTHPEQQQQQQQQQQLLLQRGWTHWCACLLGGGGGVQRW